ncbi:MAG: hypothetical protein KCHDKBKB_00898 [Elusimicrobia bacterium]|nr:hypothetical protein [Elusimicrobiota bacterium]
MLDLAIHWVELAQASFWFSLAFYVIFVVGVMGLPITLFPIIGGVLFPFWVALPMNIFAATTGAWLSFMVTRKWGERSVGTFFRKEFKAWEKFSKMEGFKTILLLRLIGVPPFIVSNYALGFSGVRQTDFITGTMIGILPWMGIVTYLAHSLWEAALVGGQKGLTKALAHALGPLILVSFSILGVMVFNYMLKRRRHSNL